MLFLTEDTVWATSTFLFVNSKVESSKTIWSFDAYFGVSTRHE